jgi:hypothetical protein
MKSQCQQCENNGEEAKIWRSNMNNQYREKHQWHRQSKYGKRKIKRGGGSAALMAALAKWRRKSASWPLEEGS